MDQKTILNCNISKITYYVIPVNSRIWCDLFQMFYRYFWVYMNYILIVHVNSIDITRPFIERVPLLEQKPQ